MGVSDLKTYNKESLFRLIVYLKLCMNRGQSWFLDIRNAVLIAAGLRVFGLTVTQAMFFAAFLCMFFVLLGYVDFRYGIWKRENEIVTREFNPFFEKIERDVADNGNRRT
jgi:membrane-bound metal-dependent hydrolase YbcI (DUF457 family)